MFNHSRRRITAVYFIMALYMIVFAFLEYTALVGTNPLQKYFLADYQLVMLDQQYYRLLLSIFAGVGDVSLQGVLSLIIACYVVHMLGSLVEELYGEFGLLFIYIASGLLGSLTGIFMMYNVSMGFSLGVMGLIGSLLAYLFLELRDEINTPFVQTLAIGFILTLFDMLASGIGMICYIVSGAIGFLIALVFIKFRKESD